jgi:transposase
MMAILLKKYQKKTGISIDRIRNAIYKIYPGEKRKVLSEDDLNYIRNITIKNHNFKQIAVSIGVSESCIRSIAIKCGNYKEKNTEIISDSIKDDIFQLRINGLQLKEISKKTNISISYISKIIKIKNKQNINLPKRVSGKQS